MLSVRHILINKVLIMKELRRIEQSIDLSLYAREISQYLKLEYNVVRLWLENHYRNPNQLVNTVCKALSSDKTSMVIAIMNNEKLS